jgi:CRP-like cAMP-binding protein
MTQDRSPLTRRLELLAKLTEQELAYLQELEAGSVHFERGTEIFYEGQRSDNAYIVQHGWGCSFKLLPTGDRQIIAIFLPGDCVDLRCALHQATDYTFLAITDLIASRIKSSRIERLFNEFSHLGVAMLLATAQDDEMVVEHLVSLGRRTAIERLAHHFLELHDRLTIAGLATGTAFDCPLTQYDLADTLGLSAIHVNRMLRELREQKMMTFADHRVDLLDIGRMQELTGYVGRNHTPIIVRGDTAHHRSC